MSRSGQGDEPVVTKEMIGLFVVFGGDLILLVVLLAIIGVASWTVAFGISALILVVFGGWAGYRWWRLRSGTETTGRQSGDGESADPLSTLKARYAAGELSDEEFEAKLDQLLESERQIEGGSSAIDESQVPAHVEDEPLEERR